MKIFITPIAVVNPFVTKESPNKACTYSTPAITMNPPAIPLNIQFMAISKYGCFIILVKKKERINNTEDVIRQFL